MNIVLDSKSFDTQADYKADEYCVLDIRCSRSIEIDGEIMGLVYSLVSDNDEYRPFGINAKLINNSKVVVEEDCLKKRYATISEVISIMKMFAKEAVLPCTVKDVLD